jgi:SAM-dependent methyltransferase
MWIVREVVGFYQRVLFPRLIDCSMRSDELRPYRRRVIPLARGRVLEVGIGSGLNLAFYDSRQVELILGLDPSAELLRRAKSRTSGATPPLYFNRRGRRNPSPTGPKRRYGCYDVGFLQLLETAKRTEGDTPGIEAWRRALVY